MTALKRFGIDWKDRRPIKNLCTPSIHHLLVSDSYFTSRRNYRMPTVSAIVSGIGGKWYKTGTS